MYFLRTAFALILYFALVKSDCSIDIYKVVDKQVKCEPTDDVTNALERLTSQMTDHEETILGLGERVDEIDPHKERELPEEVSEKVLSEY